jgi:Spy/CpxP family protein refolding chaperone
MVRTVCPCLPSNLRIRVARRRKMKKLVVTAAVLLVSGSAPLFGQEMLPEMVREGSGTRFALEMRIPLLSRFFFLENLDLSDSQREEIQAIMDDFRDENQKWMIALERENLNLREELLKEIPDLQRIWEIIQEKTRLRGEIEYAMIKRDLDIKAILTPDQIDTWRTMHRMPVKIEKQFH